MLTVLSGSEYVLCLISSGNWSAFVSSDAAFPCSVLSFWDTGSVRFHCRGPQPWPTLSPGDIWHCPETLSHVLEWGVLLASRGWWPGGLQSILQCTGWFPRRGIVRPQMSTVPRLGNPVPELSSFFPPLSCFVFVWLCCALGGFFRSLSQPVL